MKEMAKNLNSRKFEKKTLLYILLISFVLCAYISTVSLAEKEYTVYECDAKLLAMSTKIEIECDGKEFATVKGNIFRWVEDPLTMYDTEKQKVAYASDTYHFVSQDSHGIYVDGSLVIEMDGKTTLFGDKYKIYDAKGKHIADASFNAWNTAGKIVSTEGKLLAEYQSGFFRKDFKVKIQKNGLDVDDRAILMLCCSYYSDRSYDTLSKSSSK